MMHKEERSMNTVEIYVQLLGDEEGTLRPTQAIPWGKNLYKILPTPDYDPEDEVWEFLPGSIVRCETQNYQGRDYLRAIEKVA